MIQVNGREVDVKKELPEGWRKIEGAMTAPKGYLWICNNESHFNGKRVQALIREKDYAGNR